MQEVASGSLFTPASSYFHGHYGNVPFGTFISMCEHKCSHWKSLKAVSKCSPPAHLTKEDTICTKPGWDHADAAQADKYPVLMKKSIKKNSLRLWWERLLLLPAWAQGTILQPVGRVGAPPQPPAVTAAEHKAKLLLQLRLPRSPALAHPAGQPARPRRQLCVCLG